MPVALVRSSAATRRRRRPAAGYSAIPCRSTLIYKPRPAGGPSHYCPVRNWNLKQVAGGRPSLPRFLPFHRQIRTATRATSGARGPAGRSRSAGGAAPAFLFSAAPRLHAAQTDVGGQEATCEVFLRDGDRRARPQWHRSPDGAASRPGFCLPVFAYHSSGSTPAHTTLQQAGLLAGPKEQLGQATIFTYTKQTTALLLLLHAHSASFNSA